jgi:hypothetical protein
MPSQDGSSQKKMRGSLLFHSTDLIEYRVWIRKYKRMVDVKLRVVSEAEQHRPKLVNKSPRNRTTERERPGHRFKIDI